MTTGVGVLFLPERDHLSEVCQNKPLFCYSMWIVASGIATLVWVAACVSCYGISATIANRDTRVIWWSVLADLDVGEQLVVT